EQRADEHAIRRSQALQMREDMDRASRGLPPAFRPGLAQALRAEQGKLQGLLLDTKSMQATPQYSAVDEAYKKIQLTELEDNTFQAELKRRLFEIQDVLIQQLEAQQGIQAKPAGGAFN